MSSSEALKLLYLNTFCCMQDNGVQDGIINCADATMTSVIPNGYFLAYYGGSFSILGEAVS